MTSDSVSDDILISNVFKYRIRSLGMVEIKVKELTDEELKVFHNEINRRWRKKHKYSVRATNVEYYKKCKGNASDDISNKKVDIKSIILNR